MNRLTKWHRKGQAINLMRKTKTFPYKMKTHDHQQLTAHQATKQPNKQNIEIIKQSQKKEMKQPNKQSANQMS